MTHKKAPRNRTLSCSDKELSSLSNSIFQVSAQSKLERVENQLICGSIFDVSKLLPNNFVDLLILDPPYNITKSFNGFNFIKRKNIDYASWFDSVIVKIVPLLKRNATIYICSEWRTSNLIYPILEKHFIVQNRITWERDKGRGAKRNWKNNSEDIWFCTNSNEYYFDVESVKQKRKVLAPYKENGKPKDWQQESKEKYRLTYPSNLWTDLTVPFWSMSENTDHPTQKPEKLIAKLVLASSQRGDFVFDPFVGSGTSVVVANKLNRRWCGVDINMEYLCWAKKRLISAKSNSNIQGYNDGVFWDRNATNQKYQKTKSNSQQTSLLA